MYKKVYCTCKVVLLLVRSIVVNFTVLVVITVS